MEGSPQLGGIRHDRRGGFRPVGKIGEIGDEVGRPFDAAQAQPRREEAVATMLGDKSGNALVVGFRGCGAEREADFGQPQFEQAVAPPRLAVVVPLGRCPCEDFDLPVIEAEAPIDGGDLRFDSPLIRQEQSRRAAFDDGGRDVAAVDVR